MGFTPTFFPGFFVKKPLDIDTNTAFILTEKPVSGAKPPNSTAEGMWDSSHEFFRGFSQKAPMEEIALRQMQYWHAGIDLHVIEIRNWSDDIGWLYEFIQAFIPEG